MLANVVKPSRSVPSLMAHHVEASSPWASKGWSRRCHGSHGLSAFIDWEMMELCNNVFPISVSIHLPR